MMRLISLVILVSCVPLELLAQSMKVRSGEHDTYTRLVISVPKGTDWSLTQNEAMAVFSVARSNGIFDTSEVFDRIPRSRLKSLVQKQPGSPLQLELNCLCNVSSFRASESLIAIDISDDPKEKVTTLVPQPPITQVTSETAPSMVITQPSSELRQLDESHKRLMQHLKKAKRQGLLQQSAPAVSGAAIGEKKTIEFADEADDVPRSKEQLTAVTVFDQALAHVSDHIEQGKDHNACIDSSLFQISEWASAESFEKQLSAFRMSLYGEFDVLDENVALRLAKFYLHFGFGAEASQILRLNVPELQEAEILQRLALILDEGEMNETALLANQSGCDGPVAMWALLEAGFAEPGIDFSAIQLEHASLPTHLRSHIGPKLADILSEAGQTDVARGILVSSARAGDRNSADQRLAEAIIHERSGDLSTAQSKRQRVVDEDSEETPRALIELVETHRKTGDPLPSNIPALMDAYLSEYRNTETGHSFRESRIIANALAGHFSTAIDQMRQLGAVHVSAELTNNFTSLLTERASEIDFLDIVLENPERLAASLRDKTALKVGSRLISLGFGAQSNAFLNRELPSDLSISARLLKAEAALLEMKPHRALVELLGLESKEANKLRITAMWLNQDFEAAAILASSQEDSETAAVGYFLAGSYEAAAKVEGAELSQSAQSATGIVDLQGNSKPVPPLSGARWLVESSAGTRTHILDMLEKASMPSLQEVPEG